MYPVWEGMFIHSALFIAIIAAFHVLASHLTVAAVWFNLYLERRAVRENRPELYEYLKRSALGLLVFAYVYGAMTGVGIWQSTTAGNPRGISTLIHNFVLYWGSEWYMFMIDVLGIITYYYTMGRVSRETHLRLAWILALGGTGTLTLIVGILGFVLSPGAWLQNGQSLSGFFNPTYLPQLFMRFALMFVITAAWAILVASRMPWGHFAQLEIIRTAAKMGLLGLSIAVSIWMFWYLPLLPQHALQVLPTQAVPAVTQPLILIALVGSALGLVFALFQPQLQHPVISIVALIVMFGGIFGAERAREVLRKPDIIAGYMSSNQLVFSDLPARGIVNEEKRLNDLGMLGNLPFLTAPPASASGPDAPPLGVEAGRLLVIQQCSSCHSVSMQTAVNIGGSDLTLRSLAVLLTNRGRTSASDIDEYIKGIQGFPFMHPVVGRPEERAAMALYLEQFVLQSQANAAAQAGR